MSDTTLAPSTTEFLLRIGFLFSFASHRLVGGAILHYCLPNSIHNVSCLEVYVNVAADMTLGLRVCMSRVRAGWSKHPFQEHFGGGNGLTTAGVCTLPIGCVLVVTPKISPKSQSPMRT